MSVTKKNSFEQFLKEVSDLWIRNSRILTDWQIIIQDDIEGFKKWVQKYNLKFENLYFYFSDNPDKDYEEAKKYLNL